jgi:D-alanyl-D-alanine dipeptidase
MKALPWCLLFIVCVPCAAQTVASTGQLLVVTTHGWSDVPGVAQRYERLGQSFVKVGQPFAIVVGRTGLGWGRGLEPSIPAEGPAKAEGDGKSPAGVFSIGSAFGYDHQVTTRMPFMLLSPAIECVDDAKSTHYNQLVDGTGMRRDWSSSEHMRRDDELYHYGFKVNYNSPATPGRGSCIFLHIWRSPSEGTVGCTAMEQANMLMLFGWLDPKKKPLLVQLPRAEYQRHRAAWQLPAL